MRRQLGHQVGLIKDTFIRNGSMLTRWGLGPGSWILDLILHVDGVDVVAEVEVLLHNGGAAGVNGGRIDVFEKLNEKRLAGLLQRHNRLTLHANVGGATGREGLGDFTDKTLERELANQKLSALLVSANLAECDGAGTITMWALDAASASTGFASNHRCKRFAGSMGSVNVDFACRLFGACHLDWEKGRNGWVI
jgi:hypothetical protein